jgi:hypothetical protein
VLAAVLAAAALLAPTVPQGNLLSNPGAEEVQASQSGETTVPIPSWQTTSTFTVVPYGGGGAPDFFTFPPQSESQRIQGGKNFFAGGFRAGTSTATQTVDVSRAAPLIDAGFVSATLTAWLGGFLSQPDPGTVEADFVAADGSTLGSVQIGPVTPAERNNDIKFVEKGGSAVMPKGTRAIRVTMTAVQVEGTYDDAYFDNLVLAFKGPALEVSRRCGKHHRVTISARVPPGLRALSVTFRLGTKSHVDRKAPFTAAFVLGSKPATVTAAGILRVAGQRAVIVGGQVVRCP